MCITENAISIGKRHLVLNLRSYPKGFSDRNSLSSYKVVENTLNFSLKNSQCGVLAIYVRSICFKGGGRPGGNNEETHTINSHPRNYNYKILLFYH